MKKNIRNIIIGVSLISLLLVIGYFGIGQTFTNTSTKITGLVQCTGESGRYWDGDYVGQNPCGMTYWNWEWAGSDKCIITATEDCRPRYPVVSKEVSINTGKNTFKFVSTFGTGTTFGCTDYMNPHNYPNQQIEIYKDGTLIKTLQTWRKDPQTGYPNHCARKVYNEDYILTDNIGSTIKIAQTPNFHYLTEGQYWRNKYDLQLSDNIVDVQVDTSQQSIVEGQDIVIDVNLKNNLNQDMKVKLTVVFETPTIFGKVSKTEVLEKVIVSGDNVISFNVPTNTAVAELRVKPTLEISMKGINFPGLNFLGDPTKTLEWVNLKTIEKESVLITIASKPLFLTATGDICTTGYTLSPDKEYCVRDDVRELSCTILGCPTIEEHEYVCTSYGICAETVFAFKDCATDLDCPNETTCDANTGLCIKSEIFESIISKDCISDDNCPGDATCEISSGLCYKEGEAFALQCISKTDCIIPCVGISSECNQFGMCVYSGECNIQQVGCNEYGCPDGYFCDDINVCVQDKTPIYFYLIPVSIFGLIALIIWMKRKKPRN